MYLGCAGGDTDKQLVAWSRRAKVLRRMILGFAQARPPDPPSVVSVDITGTATVSVRLQEPTAQESSITTRYKGKTTTTCVFYGISYNYFPVNKEHKFGHLINMSVYKTN